LADADPVVDPDPDGDGDPVGAAAVPAGSGGAPGGDAVADPDPTDRPDGPDSFSEHAVRLRTVTSIINRRIAD